MRNKILGAAMGLLTGALVACGGGDAGEGAATPPPPPPPAATPPAAAPAQVALPEGVTQEMVTQGQAVFTGAGLCGTCHMPDGTGGPLAPNLHDATWINIDGSYDAIVNLIMTGVAEPKEHPAPMPARGGSTISDEQVRQVAAYVYTLSHGG